MPLPSLPLVWEIVQLPAHMAVEDNYNDDNDDFDDDEEDMLSYLGWWPGRHGPSPLDMKHFCVAVKVLLRLHSE